MKPDSINAAIFENELKQILMDETGREVTAAKIKPPCPKSEVSWMTEDQVADDGWVVVICCELHGVEFVVTSRPILEGMHNVPKKCRPGFLMWLSFKDAPGFHAWPLYGECYALPLGADQKQLAIDTFQEFASHCPNYDKFHEHLKARIAKDAKEGAE